MNITDFYSQNFKSNTGCRKPTLEEIAQDSAKSAAKDAMQKFDEKDPKFEKSDAKKINAKDIKKWNNALQSNDIDFKYEDNKIILTVGGKEKIVDASNFIKDGMIENVALNNGVLTFTFNTDSGVQNIDVDLTQLFDFDSKQDVISDLDEIRSNAALGATALQSFNEVDPVFSASAAATITTSNIEDWNNKLSSYTETDPTVPAWAKAENKPTYTAQEVGALPADTVIPSVEGLVNETYVTEAIANIQIPTVPTNVSAFTNDANYITLNDVPSETDPTVPAWAKAESKPTYTAQEVGALPADTVIPSLDGYATMEDVVKYCPTIEDTRNGNSSDITGVAPFETLEDGQRIILHLTYATEPNSTLNLTLSDGTTTGAKDVKYQVPNTVLPQPISEKYGKYMPNRYVEMTYDKPKKHWVCMTAVNAVNKFKTVNNETILGEGNITVLTEETDPTVPAWAKAENKPTYTAQEVGALPADTVIPTVPTNVSDFTNDANYITLNDVPSETDPVFQASPASTITTSLIETWNAKTDKEVTGSNGKALIFNESDGGGAKFEHTDGTWSFAGVNDGGENGIAGQIYALKKNDENKFEGSRIDVTKDAMYYTVGADSAADRMVENNEIATKGYVKSNINTVIGSANIDFDTLGEAQQKYNELNANYQLLLNAVYPMMQGDAATPLNANYVNNTLSTGERNVTVTEGTLGDVTIPAVTNNVVVSAPMQAGTQENPDVTSTITLTTPNKSFTLTNTTESTPENPVNVNVNAPYNDSSSSNTTIYLQGEYENITVENGSIGKASDREAPTVQNVTVNNVVDEDIENPKLKSSTVNATFTGDSENPSIITANENVSALTITNYNPSVDENEQPVTPPSIVINAEDSSVTLNSKWDEVDATVSPNTLFINGSAHINKLTCAQRVEVKVSNEDRLKAVVADYSEAPNIDYTKINIDNSNQSKMTSTAECTLTDDITKQYGWTFGVISSDYPVWKLNGKNITIQKERVGVVLLRGNACLDILGDGVIQSEDYGVWTAAENNVVNVYGGDWRCNTHALYAEKGTINVYGGTFRVTGDDKRYVLNCLDASYTANPRKAQINVYGGKFYDFNPYNSMSEPNGPVSFVAPGYHVVGPTTDETGTYYEVVEDE